MNNFIIAFLFTATTREVSSDFFLDIVLPVFGIAIGIILLYWILFMETQLESREKTVEILYILFWLSLLISAFTRILEAKLMRWQQFAILILSLFMIGGIFLWKLWKEGENETKCPNCQKPWAGQYLREELLGVFRKSERRLMLFEGKDRLPRESDYQMVWYEKFKIHYQCKYCGHEWSLLKSRRQ